MSEIYYRAFKFFDEAAARRTYARLKTVLQRTQPELIVRMIPLESATYVLVVGKSNPEDRVQEQITASASGVQDGVFPPAAARFYLRQSSLAT